MSQTDAMAFAFIPSAIEQNPKTDSNVFVQVFDTAFDCRKALACASSEVQVLITDKVGDVSPLNLAAALHKDNTARDIYLEQTKSGGLLISKANAAGVRGVVNQGQAKQLLRLPESDTGADGTKGTGHLSHEPQWDRCPIPFVPDSTGVDIASPKNLEEDLAWLDELINIDELEAAAQASAQGSAVLERPQVFEKPILQSDASPSPQVQETTEQRGQGKIAAFVSGRGGVGKSTLALLTAIELWKSGQRVALLDLDLQFGDISYLAGHESQLQIIRLDGSALLLEKAHLPVQGSELLLIESPAKPELAEDLVDKVPQLLKLLKQTADIVIVNTSCLWNEVLAVLCKSCDRLLFVMDQRSTSIQGCRQAVDLCIRLQIPSTRFNYLLNRCSRTAPITDIDAALAMGGAQIISIADGGAEVDELLSLGCPMELLQSDTPFVTSIIQLTELMMDGSGLSNSYCSNQSLDKSDNSSNRTSGSRNSGSRNSGGLRKSFRSGYGFGKSGRKGVE